MVKKIKTRIRKSSNPGIFHDSRGDIAIISKVCTELIDKVNELVEEVNELKAKQG